MLLLNHPHSLTLDIILLSHKLFDIILGDKSIHLQIANVLWLIFRDNFDK